ncbi:probable protein phosphatase CG10417 [Anopheles funestus]|uniref:probable protein phosphatase CG10417 n=1 Tax=Anopheles funestus TaxID=62324 RepID=UPI0020C641C1|nr:probable protein phosphatase CG10417 [Anopheles funestus]
MGAYLSEPLTVKDSSDEANESLAFGSSSMQGWRISQEDAHNCILNFDEKSAFFAVYDGHGGAEVARYCSLHLPAFLKTVEAYAQNDFEKALKDAFLGLDAMLLKEKVIEELKLLSNKTNDEEEADEEEEEEEDDNVEDLCKEAVMPLNEVLQKYRKDTKPVDGANQRVVALKEGNCSKPISPYLKGKRRAGSADPAAGSSEKRPPVPVEADAGSDAEADPAGAAAVAEEEESKPVLPKAENTVPDAADSTVSSSSNKTVERVKETTPQPEPSSSSSSTVKVSPGKGETADAAGSSATRKAEQSNEISDTAGNVAVKVKATDEKVAPVPSASGKDNCAPDSSSSDGSKELGNKLNGDVGKVGSSGAVSSSSSSSSSGSAGQENGVAGSGSCDSGGNVGGSNSVSPAAAKVHSSSAAAKPSPKNGPLAADVSMSMDDTDDDDDSDSDEEFPHAGEPADDTSTTDEGEEDAYGEEGSAEEEEEEPDEYADLGDYINEEDAEFMKAITDEPGKDSGCTAVVALLHGKELYVANAGDSRCVVCRNGKAQDMSFDHKPEDKIEFERIDKAGGRVTLDGRVNGGLNLSRAIGDHGYKMNKSLPPEEQMISALPDIEKITIGPEDDFMVLACDGIWNFLTSEQVVQFVQERINKPGMKLSKICEELFDHCLAPHTRGDGTGCDNMTAIIVQFKPNFTGGASRKRTATSAMAGSVDESDADAVSSATKKVKTDATNAAGDDASSTTETTDGSNGVSAGKDANATEETEAAAAVASIADDVMAVDVATSEAASSST